MFRNALPCQVLVAFALGLGLATIAWWGWRGEGMGSPSVEPPGAVQLRVQLMAGERVLREGGGRLVLPEQARFQVRAQAGQGGVLEVWAANAQGEPAATPLYTSAVLPGQVIDSIPLSVRGPAGTDTLIVRLRAQSRGVVAEEVFQLWHP